MTTENPPSDSPAIIDDPAPSASESARVLAFMSGPPQWRGAPLKRAITIGTLSLFHELRERVGAPPLAETLSTGRFLADALRILWLCSEEESALEHFAGNLPAAVLRCRKWAEENTSIAEAPAVINTALLLWNQAHETRPEIIPDHSAPSPGE